LTSQRLATVFIAALVLSAAYIATMPQIPGKNVQASFGGLMRDSDWIWPPVVITALAGLLYWKYRPPDMGNVIDVRDEKELVGYITNPEGKTVVIDFTTDACPYCGIIAPVYGRLSKLPKYKDKAIFLSVDARKFQQVMVEAGVQATPTFVFYKNMKVVQRMAGPPADKLEKYFDALILSQKKTKKKKNSNKDAAVASGGSAAAGQAAPSTNPSVDGAEAAVKAGEAMQPSVAIESTDDTANAGRASK